MTDEWDKKIKYLDEAIEELRRPGSDVGIDELEWLVAELKAAWKELEEWHSGWKEKKMDAIIEQNEKMIEALNFYANSNWNAPEMTKDYSYFTTVPQVDKGSIARQCLTEIKVEK